MPHLPAVECYLGELSLSYRAGQFAKPAKFDDPCWFFMTVQLDEILFFYVFFRFGPTRIPVVPSVSAR